MKSKTKLSVVARKSRYLVRMVKRLVKKFAPEHVDGLDFKWEIFDQLLSPQNPEEIVFRLTVSAIPHRAGDKENRLKRRKAARVLVTLLSRSGVVKGFQKYDFDCYTFDSNMYDSYLHFYVELRFSPNKLPQSLSVERKSLRRRWQVVNQARKRALQTLPWAGFPSHPLSNSYESLRSTAEDAKEWLRGFAKVKSRVDASERRQQYATYTEDKHSYLKKLLEYLGVDTEDECFDTHCDFMH